MRAAIGVVSFVVLQLVGAQAAAATATCTTATVYNFTPFSGTAFQPPHVPAYRPVVETADRKLRIDMQNVTGCCWGAANVPSKFGLRVNGEVFQVSMTGGLMHRTIAGLWAAGAAGVYQAVTVSVTGTTSYTFAYHTLGTDADAFLVTITNPSSQYLNITVQVDSTNTGLAGALCTGTQNPTITLAASHLSAAYQPADLVTTVSAPTPIALTGAVQTLYTVNVANALGTNVSGAAASFTALPTAFGALSWSCTAVGGATCTAASGTTATPPTFDVPLGASVQIDVAGTATAVVAPQVLSAASVLASDWEASNDTGSASLVGRWRTDADSDGWGVDGSFALLLPGEVAVGDALMGGDCKDDAPAVHPGAAEVCNGVDDDCSGTGDDNLTDPWLGQACCPTGNLADCQNTGGGTRCQSGLFACVGGAQACPGAVSKATETCNGVDDDCDGVVDPAALCAGPDAGTEAGPDAEVAGAHAAPPAGADAELPAEPDAQAALAPDAAVLDTDAQLAVSDAASPARDAEAAGGDAAVAQEPPSCGCSGFAAASPLAALWLLGAFWRRRRTR
jgi:hypothetical protein